MASIDHEDNHGFVKEIDYNEIRTLQVSYKINFEITKFYIDVLIII